MTTPVDAEVQAAPHAHLLLGQGELRGAGQAGWRTDGLWTPQEWRAWNRGEWGWAAGWGDERHPPPAVAHGRVINDQG